MAGAGAEAALLEQIAVINPDRIGVLAFVVNWEHVVSLFGLSNPQ